MVGFPNKPMGFPTKNDHFVVFGGYHHLRKRRYEPNNMNQPDVILFHCSIGFHHVPPVGQVGF